MENILFYGGIIVMGSTAAAAVVSAVVLRVCGKQLAKKLTAEYGEKRC